MFPHVDGSSIRFLPPNLFRIHTSSGERVRDLNIFETAFLTSVLHAYQGGTVAQDGDIVEIPHGRGRVLRRGEEWAIYDKNCNPALVRKLNSEEEAAVESVYQWALRSAYAVPATVSEALYALRDDLAVLALVRVGDHGFPNCQVHLEALEPAASEVSIPRAHMIQSAHPNSAAGTQGSLPINLPRRLFDAIAHAHDFLLSLDYAGMPDGPVKHLVEASLVPIPMLLDSIMPTAVRWAPSRLTKEAPRNPQSVRTRFVGRASSICGGYRIVQVSGGVACIVGSVAGAIMPPRTVFASMEHCHSYVHGYLDGLRTK
jgi:hypothetical protein